MTERKALERLVRAALEYCHTMRDAPMPDVGPERELRPGPNSATAICCTSTVASAIKSKGVMNCTP